ncbi:trypsin-1-like protein, partial [Dinothrombium tinctorium]
MYDAFCRTEPIWVSYGKTPFIDAFRNDYEEEMTTERSIERKKYCGISKIKAQARIIGGLEAREKEIPWQVGIQEMLTDGDGNVDYIIKGGGSILNKRWILTAAHIFSDLPINQTRGIIGTVSSANPKKIINFEKLFIHPNFSSDTFKNDIALLRTNVDMQLFPLDDSVNEICLPQVNETLPKMAVVSGWGADDKNYIAEGVNNLMSVTIKIVDNSSCEKLYPNFDRNLMICAGDLEGSKDSCN